MATDLDLDLTFWPAERASFEDATSFRDYLVKQWARRGKRDPAFAELARLVGSCREDQRCGAPECPICEFLRRQCPRCHPPKRARDMRVTPPPAQAPKVAPHRMHVGKKAGFSAPEKLGIKKEGFGAGKVPANGAKVLKFPVVTAPPTSADAGGKDGCRGAYHDQGSGVIPERGNSKSGPEGPDGGDAA